MYKHVFAIRTVLCAAFLIFFVAPLAHAADPIFTIENVEVDVTAENAIKAREQAFGEAQIKAFDELKTRMLSEAEVATFQTPDPITISTLIKDFEIVNEQLSSVRYVGTYTFRFKGNAVRRYFSGTGAVYTDISSAQSLLILPYMQMGAETVIWSPFNAWMQAWNRAGNLQGLVPMEAPLGDLDDVRDVRDNEALSYNINSLNAMLQRYNAGEAVIAIAIPDAQLAQIPNASQTAAGRLSIEIYRTDRREPELVQQVNVIADGAQTKSQLYDAAVSRVKAELQKDWKTRTFVTSESASRLEVIVPIQSLSEWVGIQSDLKRIRTISDAKLKSLAPSRAVVDLMYRGDSERLMLTLRQAGFTLERQTNDMGQPVNILIRGSGGYQNTFQPARL